MGGQAIVRSAGLEDIFWIPNENREPETPTLYDPKTFPDYEDTVRRGFCGETQSPPPFLLHLPSAHHSTQDGSIAVLRSTLEPIDWNNEDDYVGKDFIEVVGSILDSARNGVLQHFLNIEGVESFLFARFGPGDKFCQIIGRRNREVFIGYALTEALDTARNGDALLLALFEDNALLDDHGHKPCLQSCGLQSWVLIFVTEKQEWSYIAVMDDFFLPVVYRLEASISHYCNRWVDLAIKNQIWAADDQGGQAFATYVSS
ncbi:hypothetical protein P152DRAFT_489296 [Eremomyces bilateralis CBS 781.70]|uniref:Uncharacterized protein n=1 Tax=Eremomyces bilateralis CBS 781.70 TaxID=1392243 RepID=A0A6G1G0H7_9PEZI|nr:uncharacterized protein P152DRAFT_489296 [Eremomyces bilateralis CBS 781.70]KAF1811543.1 hypothetical protein P152DRAFT_489296 [Eremomyces bilateralis CBS 781.70]